MSTAHTVLCHGCGGTIPLTSLDPSVRCPFCAHVQTLPEAQRQELASYQHAVAHQLGRAADEHARAASMEKWTGGRGASARLSTTMAIFGVMFGVLVLLGGITQWVIMTIPGNRKEAEVLLPIAIPVIVAATFIAYMIWYYGGERSKRARALPPVGRGTCPRCGAANALAPGQVLVRCSHCGTSLLPSKTMMVEGFGAAEAELHRAEIARYRSERSGFASAMRMSAAGVMGYVVVGSFLPMTLGGAVAFTADGLSKGQLEPGVGAIWAIAAFNVAILVAIILYRRMKRERWSHLVALTARRFVHRDIVTIDGLVHWLNEHWAGPVPLTEIYAGPYFQASALVLGDYMALVVANPTALADGYPPYVSVYLSAWIPALRSRVPFDPSPIAAQCASLERLGFRIAIDGAGLRAFATQPSIGQLAKDGHGDDLVHVANALHESARILGARSVELPD
ncbi:hypothetical protein BH09MYX1_BH09MYX1_08740 [soil metagenome]